MLHDDICRETTIPDFVRNFLRDAIVIRADNVARYFWDVLEKEEWDLFKDFPNLCPPFPKMFFEWQATKTESLLTLGEGVPNLDRFGCFVYSRDLGKSGPNYARWEVSISPFMKFFDGRVTWAEFDFRFLVSENGSAVRVSDDRAIQVACHSRWAKENSDLYAKGFITFSGAVLLSISFMHCKNVELVEHKPGRTHRERRHRPRITYHTLEIEPMKKVLRSEGKSGETGIKMALHICRGHFKDFSKGKGLFGKYKGLYWWDSQVRGDVEQGEARKDYSISPPS